MPPMQASYDSDPTSKVGTLHRDPPTLQQSPVAATISALRQSWYVIIACTVLATTAGYVASARQPDSFKATAALLFQDRTSSLAQQLFGSAALLPSQDAERQGATNLRLVSLSTVARRTANALRAGFTVADIQRMVVAEPAGNSNLIAITATSGDRKLAALVANTFAQQYVAFRRASDRSNLLSAVRTVRDQLDERGTAINGVETRELNALNDRLQVLATLQTGNAEIVQTAAVPRLRSAPRPKRSAAFGALLGLVLGAGLALLRRQFDQRLRGVGELESLTGWPVLAAVPLDRALSTRPRAAFAVEPRFLEAFRLLRARLRYFNVDRDVRSLLVSSGLPGEGKTTVLLQLARVCAQAGDRVVIVEADLRRPTISTRLGLPASLGLAEMLGQHLELASVTQDIEDPSLGIRFSVIAAGASPPNPVELLESARMAYVLEELHNRFDVILIDSPPTSVVSDTIPLMQRVDGVLIISRFGVATRGAARALATDLRRLGAPVLGIVANTVSTDGLGGYNAYYYSSPSSSEPGPFVNRSSS